MNNTRPSRKVSPITKVLGTWLRKLLLLEETPQSGAFQAGQNNTNACESACVKMTKWMNEAIMPMMLYSEHCVVTQESQSFSARPPYSSFGYSCTAGLVDFGRTDVVAQWGCSASFQGGKSLLPFLSREWPNRNSQPRLKETQISQNKPFTEDTSVPI